MLPSALVFDHHTHLTHDLAPALDRSAPVPDANRMSVVMEWMMAARHRSHLCRNQIPEWGTRRADWREHDIV